MEPVNKTETKKWSSIDIYLFSNGQQYSPPRKYHLRSDELQWWETTISYLGRTHYGSGHGSIDIYTTDGIKINGPLELINGAAYVAVEPPDTFVNTGYEEYLLRASRSWDKRLILKSAFNPETTDPKLNGTADDTIAPVENASSQIGDNTTSTVKSQPSKPRQLQQKKAITSPKQIQKKKSSDPHNTTLKRICAETDKIFPCPRKTSVKNEFPNRKRPSLVPCNRNVSQEQSICSKNASYAKSQKSKDNECLGVQAEPKTSNRAESLQYPVFSHDDSKDLNPQSRKNRILSDTIPDEVQTVESLYHNNDHNVTSMTSNPDSNRKIEKSENELIRNFDLKDLKNDNNDSAQQDAILQETERKGKLREIIINKGVDSQTTSEIKTTTKHDNGQTSFHENNILSKDDKDRQAQSNITPNENARETRLDDGNLSSHFSDKEATDEYIAYMNKGGLLLLKVNVKVKDCKAIINRNKSNDTQVTSSIINLLKTEKISQVDIDLKFSRELMKSNNGQCVQDKSLQSLINNLYSEDSGHIDNKRPRIIIIKCACRDYPHYAYHREEENTICGCIDKEEKNPLPRQEISQMISCCQCYNETYRPSKDTQNIILNEYSTKDHRSSIPKPNGPRVSYLAQKFENADKSLSDKSRNEHLTPGVTSKLKDSSVLEASIERPVSENIDSTSKSRCDKSIQTDWSNVILEARRHEDENYTFHLPSLYVLKHCKL